MSFDSMTQIIPSVPSSSQNTQNLCTVLCEFLEGSKAENIVSIDLSGKSAFADFMIIASGRSQLHLRSLGEKLREFLHKQGVTHVPMEGLEQCDWVLVDAGDIIIHLFRPEVREFYNLEKMWAPAFREPQQFTR